jgi:hypothetical protein
MARLRREPGKAEELLLHALSIREKKLMPDIHNWIELVSRTYTYAG